MDENEDKRQDGSAPPPAETVARAVRDAPPPVVRRRAIEIWAETWIAACSPPTPVVGKRPKVLAIDVAKGRVTASVRYQKKGLVDVAFAVEILPESAWKAVGEVFAAHTLAVARLLAGDLPEIFVAELEQHGVRLLPDFDTNVVTRCDCDEALLTCDHRAAVVELIAEEIARDPFLLFLWRGRDRGEVLRLLGDEEDLVLVGDEHAHSEPADPLPDDPEQFWAVPVLEPLHLGEVREPEVPGVLVRRLGEFPFWRGTRALLPALEQMYRRATKAALEVLRGG
jgi:uncharacterized Zn finger protein